MHTFTHTHIETQALEPRRRNYKANTLNRTYTQPTIHDDVLCKNQTDDRRELSAFSTISSAWCWAKLFQPNDDASNLRRAGTTLERRYTHMCTHARTQVYVARKLTERRKPSQSNSSNSREASVSCEPTVAASGAPFEFSVDLCRVGEK